MSKTVEAWAAELDVTPRSVRRWLSLGKIPPEHASHVNGKWIIHDDATPPPDGRGSRSADKAAADLALAQGVAVAARKHGVQDPNVPANLPPAPVDVPRSYDAPSTMARRFWFTVDDLVVLFDPLVSRHAIVKMLRSGEIVGYQRGRNGAWVIPASELRRITGA